MKTPFSQTPVGTSGLAEQDNESELVVPYGIKMQIHKATKCVSQQLTCIEVFNDVFSS